MRQRSSGSVKVFYPPCSREELVEVLRRRVQQLRDKLPLRRAVLFGSWASGRHTVASDIDVLVLYGADVREDAYALVKQMFRVPRLEPHVYAESEYAQMNTTLERMVEGGIELTME